MSDYISEMNEQEPLPDDHEQEECPPNCKVHPLTTHKKGPTHG